MWNPTSTDGMKEGGEDNEEGNDPRGEGERGEPRHVATQVEAIEKALYGAAEADADDGCEWCEDLLDLRRSLDLVHKVDLRKVRLGSGWGSGSGRVGGVRVRGGGGCIARMRTLVAII